MRCTDYWKVLVLNFSMMGNTVFFWVKKLIEKMIFTDYWKVVVLNLSVVGNTVFFWVKKMMERWYLLVKEKFLFWTFRWWEIRSFYQPKSWWKDDTYLDFLSFPWYFGTWEIRFFVQWPLHKVLEKHKRKTPYIIVFSGDNKSVRERTF